MNRRQRESLARVAYNVGQATAIAGVVGSATGSVRVFGFVLLVAVAAIMVGIGVLLEKEASDENGD